MRRVRVRFDIWVCLALVCLVGWGIGKVMDRSVAGDYEKYVQEHVVADGDTGGIAGEEVFRAQSVEDLLSHDTFTVVSPGIKYRNEGAGYYGSNYLYSLALPSGERVAAAINMDSVQSGENYYTGDSILPVGRVVYEDLTQNKSFISQIESHDPLSRTDFYVDMLGDGGTMSLENYQKYHADSNKTMVQVCVGVVLFPILHMLGAKLGIFPYFFPPKKKKTSEWE